MGLYPSVPTLLPADVADLSTAVFQGVFNKPALEQFHGVRTGIKGQTRIPIMGTFSGLLGSIQDNCAVDVDAGGITTSSKNWTPKYLSGRVEVCYTDLMGTFAQWLSANGLAKENLSNNTAFATYAAAMLSDALYESVLTHAWLGDTAAVAGTNNNIASGDLKYFTAIDGFWKQAVAIGAADATKRITITKNSAVTFALQKFDATDTTNQVVTGYFESAIRTAADFRLKDFNNSEKVIVATDSLVEQYRAERKKASGIDLAYTRVENGIDELTCDGVPVIPFSLLDRRLKGYFLGTASAFTVNPHRFIHTSRAAMANLLIGTEQVANLGELDIDYDKKSKIWFADYGYVLDAKIGDDTKIVVGY